MSSAKKTTKKDQTQFELLDEQETNTKNQEQSQHACSNCESANAKANEYKQLLQLTVADFDNYRKRSLKMLQDAKADGELNVIMRFLPALDSFEKARKMITDENILKGFDMVEKEIRESLSQLGVKQMDSLGCVFDPTKHNAIATSNKQDVEEDVITDVYQQGYVYNDKVIRYAQVIVNKK
jgi:molecular chaperone GrpE